MCYKNKYLVGTRRQMTDKYLYLLRSNNEDMTDVYIERMLQKNIESFSSKEFITFFQNPFRTSFLKNTSIIHHGNGENLKI